MDTYQNIVGEQPSLPVAEQTVTRGVVEAWMAEGVIDKSERWQTLSVLYPRESRNAFIRRAWLGLMAVFFLAGLSAIVAANWDNLGVFLRLGGAMAVYLVLVYTGLRQGLDSTHGKVLLSAAGFVSGMLLVIVTQYYQLNVDGIWFYGTWCCFVLPFALVADYLPLWIGWSILLRLLLLNCFTDFDSNWQTRQFAMEYRTWSVLLAAAGTIGLRHFLLGKFPQTRSWLAPQWARFLFYVEAHAVTVGLFVMYFGEVWHGLTGGGLWEGRVPIHRVMLLPICVALLVGVHFHLKRGGLKEIWFITLSVLSMAVSAVTAMCIMIFERTRPSEWTVFLVAVIAFVIFVLSVIYVRRIRERSMATEVPQEVIYE